MEPEGKLLRLETEWQVLFSDMQRGSGEALLLHL